MICVCVCACAYLHYTEIICVVCIKMLKRFCNCKLRKLKILQSIITRTGHTNTQLISVCVHVQLRACMLTCIYNILAINPLKTRQTICDSNTDRRVYRLAKINEISPFWSKNWGIFPINWKSIVLVRNYGISWKRWPFFAIVLVHRKDTLMKCM